MNVSAFTGTREYDPKAIGVGHHTRCALGVVGGHRKQAYVEADLLVGLDGLGQAGVGCDEAAIPDSGLLGFCGTANHFESHIYNVSPA